MKDINEVYCLYLSLWIQVMDPLRLLYSVSLLQGHTIQLKNDQNHKKPNTLSVVMLSATAEMGYSI